jgi:hypothetical protein
MNDRNNSIAYSWMSRRSPPSGKPFVLLPVDKPVGRHSVIRTTLPDWHSHKSWVDKVRGSLEEKK